jgi:EpsD family peptidyl-prolyl cis-trans isomerase
VIGMRLSQPYSAMLAITHSFGRAARAGLALVALATLVACGGGNGATGHSSGQVAAHVNKGEVSLHQVQYLLQHQPRLAAARPDVAPKLVLDSLDEQELAAQAAREQGIENDPAFVQGMEAARRELLARMYQERLSAKVALPSSDDIDRYYDEHPALFGQRKLYTVQEFMVDVPAQGQAALQQVVEQARSATELRTALDHAGLQYRTGVTVQAPEAVPMRLLETLSKLDEGRSMVHTATPNAVQLWTLLKTQEAAVDRKHARGAIEAYLVTERKRQAVDAGMSELRQKAQIVYAGPFASAASAAAGTTRAN